MTGLHVGEGSEGHSVSTGSQAANQFHLLDRLVVDASPKVPERTDVVITEGCKAAEGKD